MVPGVSGGTMAMILGIYDQLITAISSFKKNPKQNVSTLTLFVLGAGTGILLFSTPLLWLLEHYEKQVMYFFIGAVFGGIPVIQKKSGIQKISWKAIGYMVCGIGSVFLIASIPTSMFALGGNVLSLLLVGIIAAAPLILPGISISHWFLIVGIYEEILHAIASFKMAFLLPLGIGVVLGIVLFSKLLEHVMEKYPKPTYLVILGFILGSIASIFPGVPIGGELIWCAALAITGFGIMYKVSKI